MVLTARFCRIWLQGKTMRTTRIHWRLVGLLVGCALNGALPLSAGTTTCDFAERSHVNDWLRHPVYGDPSFDSFKRLPGNPIHRGAPPFEWPVNGFFYPDSRTGNWYVFIATARWIWAAPGPISVLSFRATPRCLISSRGIQTRAHDFPAHRGFVGIRSFP